MHKRPLTTVNPWRLRVYNTQVFIRYKRKVISLLKIKIITFWNIFLFEQSSGGVYVTKIRFLAKTKMSYSGHQNKNIIIVGNMTIVDLYS